MATFDVAKLLNKITQDIPGINTVLKALANWDVSALSDVPDGAMQATTDAKNRLTIKKKVSGAYAPVAKLMHDVDTVDGYHASASATANTVAVRNASGALPGNILGNAVTADTATALATGSVVPVNQGGTGATTASQARANLGVADGADFTTHVATHASPSVEGHVKLDALAADGSNTAAPGGFGLGNPPVMATDFDTCTKNGWYYGTNTALNSPPVPASYYVFVQAFNGSNIYQKAYRFNGTDCFVRQSTGVWSDWVPQPLGITDSISTTSSKAAASATAVKTAYDAASDAQTDASTALAHTAPATTTSRGIGRAATSADLVDGATINNGPAFLSAGDAAIKAWIKSLFGDVGDLVASLATSKADHLLCNGGLYSRTTYAGLFALIGTSFGAGDGSTTFKVPDFRGRTLQGANANLMAVLAAGLPNFAGFTGLSSADGALAGPYYKGATIYGVTGVSYSPNPGVFFDPRRVSDIYGASATVQSPAIAVNIFIKY